MVILFASFIGFLLFIEISLLTSLVDEIMAIVLAFLTYAIGFFSLMIPLLEEQNVSARPSLILKSENYPAQTKHTSIFTSITPTANTL